MTQIGNKARAMFTTMFASIVVTVAHGSDWYVDAVNGNDAWDGTAAIVPSEGSSGPRKTLVKVMELASAGDTIYAAEGDYNSGEILANGNTTSNRVVVKAGVLLTASGRRISTYISGKTSTMSGHDKGNNIDAIRAVFFASPTAEESSSGIAGGVVKGFTIRNGRTAKSGNDTNCNGGGAFGPGLVVDCDFINNGCYYRGGNVSGATLVRCKVDPAAVGTFELVGSGQAADTLFNNATAVYPNSGNAKIVNCSFTYRAAYSCNVYNCLFLDPDGGTSVISGRGNYYNSFSRGAQGSADDTIADKDAACRFNLTAEQTVHVEGCARPLSGSVVLDAGISDYYDAFTNGWKAGWLVHWTRRDYAGNERVFGASIDVGCCEWFADDLTMYVDADNGNDDNAGLSESKPKRTLAAAVEAAAYSRLGISLVKAAAGTYSEGSMSSGVTTGPARVVIPNGVKLEGAGADVTFIEGAQATCPIKDGCGTNSLRCAYLGNTAILRGFTLRNGYAWYTGEDSYNYSGGGTKGNGLVVDCVYSNNTSCYRGGSLNYGTFVRCYFGPAVSKDFDICRYKEMVDCVFGLDNDGMDIYNQDEAKIFNCTFINGIPRSDSAKETQIYNSLILNSRALSGVCKLFTCMSVGALGASSSEGDGYNLFSRSSQKLGIDSVTFRPLKNSLARNAGDGDGAADYRSLITNGWSEAWIAELGDKDFAGGKRVVGGRVDVGAGEYVPSTLGFFIFVR